jgi:AcrR family transcriptional regulator
LRREREKHLRRQTILRAAEVLFAKNGYRKTRIEDIADHAEVSVGTVYGYFENKEDLLVTVLDEIGLYVRTVAGNAFAQADSTLEGIERAGIAFFRELCLPYPEKVLLIYDESIGLSEQFIRARKQFMQKMTADVHRALIQVRDALGLRYTSEISAEVMAVCTTSIYVWLGYYYKLWQKDPDEIQAIGKETVAFIVGGIRSLINGADTTIH